MDKPDLIISDTLEHSSQKCRARSTRKSTFSRVSSADAATNALKHSQKMSVSTRYRSWSSRALEDPIWEVDETAAADMSRDPFVMSMAADDKDWTKYNRRRSSGGTSVMLYQQNSSRRSSLVNSDASCDSSIMNKSALAYPEIHDQNGNISKMSAPESLDEEPAPTLPPRNRDHLMNGSNSSQRQRRIGSVNTSTHMNSSLQQDNYIRQASDPGPVHHVLASLSQPHMKKLSRHQTGSDEAFDISGQTSENRFPWLRDIGTQCDPVEDNITRPHTVRGYNQHGITLKSNRSHSNHAIFAIRESGSVQDTRSQSSGSLSELHGKVILEPQALLHRQEFFSEQSADSEGLEEDSELKRYKARRRPCIISNLDLEPNHEAHTNEGESFDGSSYPGDLVLHNGLVLQEAKQYGSDSSLGETSNHPTIEKTKSLKSNKSFLKLLRQSKSKPDSLENFLCHSLKTSEFKDERLINYRHMRWTEVISDLGEASDIELKRRDTVWELFTSECVFLIDHLMVLKHCFMEPLKECQVQGLLMDVEPDKLFGNLDELCHISYAFCKDFVNTLKSSASPTEFGGTHQLCECLDKMTLNSRGGGIYHSYLLNYKSALTYLESLRNTIEEIGTFEKFCEQDSRCNRLKLTDLLIAPMHHWTRLPLILQRLRKYTENPDEAQRLEESADRVISSLKSLENKMEWQKTFERVKEIQQQLIWPSLPEMDSKVFIPESVRGYISSQPCDELFADQMREVVYEGQLMLTEKDKSIDIYAFLFTDFLLFTKFKKDTKKTRGRMSTVERVDGFYHVHKQPLQIDCISVHDISSTEANSNNMKNAFAIVQRNTFQQVIAVLTIQAHTSLGKERWMSYLDDAKEKLQELNNNEEDDKRGSIRKMLNESEGIMSNSLLKNSRVLEITSSTLPRTNHNNSIASGRGLNKIHSELDMSTSNKQPPFESKSRTMSTGSLELPPRLSIAGRKAKTLTNGHLSRSSSGAYDSDGVFY